MTSLFVIALSLAVPQAGAAAPAPTRAAIVEAEDARARTESQLELLVHAARTASPLQAAAVRALGRLARPELVSILLPILDAADAKVRAECANALAQAAGADPAAARRAHDGLMQRLVGEPDAEARGAIGAALGRLPITSADLALATERALVDITRRAVTSSRVEKQAAGGRIIGLTLSRKTETAVPLQALVGALRGLESMARAKARAKQTFAPETLDRLRTIAQSNAGAASGTGDPAAIAAEAASVRRLAMLCLLPVGAVDATIAARAGRDPDEQVRRLAMTASAAARDTIGRGLVDPAWLVRYEALRAYGRRFQPSEGCGAVVAAIADESAHVSLLATDMLAGPCRPGDKAAERLVDLAAPGPGETAWHRPSHAIVALATAAPDEASRYLERFTSAAAWQARMYAARAAAKLSDTARLRSLARDADTNVRDAALAGLSKTAGHDGDDLFVEALGAPDFQLVMTGAKALAGTTGKATAVPALLAALARLTALDTDTSRDPRVAILERLQELGSAASSSSISPYLNDPDPHVAELAATVLSAWTGATVTAAPRPRAETASTPSDAELQRLARTIVRVTMAGGGEFEIRLLADLAPVSCARFVALAASGYYDGLTFHRVIPNFLVQGGSPGANEYSGYRRFSRDEPGRPSQARGTIGTSTRGPDTGDAQFYVNLVDTPRLDHEYSIFAEVSRGMDVVDRVLEGDVMKKVTVIVR